MTQAEQRLNVPYIKLKFFIDFPNGAVLPEHKVSAMRGTMGRRCSDSSVCETETVHRVSSKKTASYR